MKTLFFRSTALAAWAATTLPLSAQTLFSDNFDANTSANWQVNVTSTDARAFFRYDYSLDGIPAAPNSLGTTFGLKFEANFAAPTSEEAVSASPLGQGFTGDYTLRFDMWLNINGPFPGGGAGSTTFLAGGVGTTGDHTQSTLPATASLADGAWFSVDGEGGTTIDFRAHRLGTIQTPATGAYAAGTDAGARNSTNSYYHTTFPGGQSAPAAQQAAFPGPGAGTNQTGTLALGTVGFAWRDVVITKTGADVSWSIDGLAIATLTNAVLAGSNIFVGFYDVFTTSIPDNPAMNFGLVDNVRVVAVPEPSAIALGILGAGALIWRSRRRRSP